MDYNLITNIKSCYTDIPSLLYYSHIPPVVIVLFFGFFVLLKSKENKLSGKILFYISLVFSFWVMLEGMIWLVYSSTMMLFLWSFLGLLYVLLHILSLYFVYAVIDKKDISLNMKYIFTLLVFPIILLTSTIYNLKGFYVDSCSAMENDYFNGYRYFLGITTIIWIMIIAYSRYRRADHESKKQILFLGIGILSFLMLFSWSEISGSLTQNWDITQYGLFGMPVFIGFLAYLIVKFKAFNIKLLGAQALIVSLIVLIASQFAFIQNNTNRILTGITLLAATILGWQLIKSVKKEVAQREELEIVNKELDRLDKAKNEFINIASHQLRTPITVIKGVVSMIQQGDMDKLPAETKTKFYDGAMIKCNKLEEIINDILNATSLTNTKLNVMDRAAEDIEIKDFFEKMVEGFKVETLGRDIDLTIGQLDETVPVIQGQRKYLEEAFSNLITNAIKYTPSSKKTNDIRDTREGAATIVISNKREGDNLIFSVKDNGIGIPPEEIPHLFQKFFRAKNATAMYTDGTGLGLFIIKEIAQGHGGDVWVESEMGKGTTFFIKLPIKQVGQVNVKKFIEAQANLKM